MSVNGLRLERADMVVELRRQPLQLTGNTYHDS